MLVALAASVQPLCTLATMIPLIGVSTYVAEASWATWTRRAAVLPENYFELVAAAGGRPLLVPPPSRSPEGPAAGADEVVLLGDDGHVAEAPTANVFACSLLAGRLPYQPTRN